MLPAARAGTAPRGARRGPSAGYLTAFKPVFDVHAPSEVVVMGSMSKPRQVDFLQPSGRALIHLNDGGNLMASVTSLHAVHPLVHIIAGANNSGRLMIWRH